MTNCELIDCIMGVAALAHQLEHRYTRGILTALANAIEDGVEDEMARALIPFAEDQMRRQTARERRN